MITSLGYGTYFFFASLMILMGIWAFFFIPETKGLSLEDMDRLFGVPERAGESGGINKELELEKADGAVVESTEDPVVR
ncbi:hypothetical protein Q9L58_006809 [Maublancomyces gigas]|uniref:Major facilitator superfamily (MFS) profile domain-containing protein n=1 Tax=Discina gigas TaxID=1032678 RepID=A0ABR3GEW5_9PEZI